MKQQLIFSFKALLKTKKFLNCIIFAIVIAFALEFLMFKDAEKLYKIGNPHYAFFFISIDNSVFLGLFLMILPLLCILPYGDTYYREKEFINQIFIRTSKVNYFIINNFLAFITGFLFIFVLLIFMYFFNFLLLRASVENPFYVVTSFSENGRSTLMNFPFLTNLLFEHPTLYILSYIMILSSYAGLLSLTTYSISLWAKNKMVAYIVPFAITTISIPITLLLPSMFSHWPPHLVFSPNSGIVEYHGLAFIFWISLFLCLSIYLNFRKYREDVIE